MVKVIDRQRTKLLIATPTHGGGMKREFVESLSNLLIAAPHHNVMANVQFVTGSILHKLRNQLLAYFMDSGASHLLMVDDDVKFKPDSIFRLLTFDKPFSALAVPFKRTDEQAGFDLNKLLSRDPESGMLTTNRVGTSLILLKRQAVEKMFSAYPNLKANGFGTEQNQTAANKPLWLRFNKFYFNLFDWGLDPDGTICPEDFTFCDRWTALGEQIFIDDSQVLGHVGNKVFEGRLRDGRQAVK